MKNLLILILLFSTQSTAAQLKNGLYLKRSIFIHTWDDFAIVDNDTAYAYLLSEIHFALQIGRLDTLYKRNDSLYSGEYYKLFARNGQLYLVGSKSREKERPNRHMKTADPEIKTIWSNRHEKLLNDSLIPTPSHNQLYNKYRHLGVVLYPLESSR